MSSTKPNKSKLKPRQLKLMSRAEYEKWISSLPQGLCVFCHPEQYRQIVLRETENWFWVVCIAPYFKYHTMIIPKKHYTDIDELPESELHEMINLFNYARTKLVASNLKYDDGTPIYQFMFLWRIRNAYSSEVNANKPSHFHLHLMPDREYLLDPIMDPDAYKMNVELLKT